MPTCLSGGKRSLESQPDTAPAGSGSSGRWPGTRRPRQATSTSSSSSSRGGVSSITLLSLKTWKTCSAARSTWWPREDSGSGSAQGSYGRRGLYERRSWTGAGYHSPCLRSDDSRGQALEPRMIRHRGWWSAELLYNAVDNSPVEGSICQILVSAIRSLWSKMRMEDTPWRCHPSRGASAKGLPGKRRWQRSKRRSRGTSRWPGSSVSPFQSRFPSPWIRAMRGSETPENHRREGSQSLASGRFWNGRHPGQPPFTFTMHTVTWLLPARIRAPAPGKQPVLTEKRAARLTYLTLITRITRTAREVALSIRTGDRSRCGPATRWWPRLHRHRGLRYTWAATNGWDYTSRDSSAARISCGSLSGSTSLAPGSRRRHLPRFCREPGPAVQLADVPRDPGRPEEPGRPPAPARLQNRSGTSSEPQVFAHCILPDHIWVVNPADCPPWIACYLPRLQKILDDRLERLVHHFLRQVLPQGPPFVFAAVLLNELFNHLDRVELGTVCARVTRWHEWLLVV